MKFLVLLMAPGFHFLWMNPPPKVTCNGYHHSLFLPHPLQYHIHMLYLMKNIVILILQSISIIWKIWKREKVTRLKKNLFHIERKYLQYQKMIFWLYQGPVFPGFLRHG